MEIALGILASLIASIVWYWFTTLVDMQSKDKIDYALQMAEVCAHQFITAVEYQDYRTAANQADRLLDLYLRVYDHIHPLTYLPPKRKLFLTFLYNAVYFTAQFKYMNVGYSDEEELKSRCEKYKHEYLYEVQVWPDDGLEPFLTLSLSIMRDVNRARSMKKALQNNIHIRHGDKNKVYHELVGINSFRDSSGIDYFMNKGTFSADEYKRYINRKVPN